MINATPSEWNPEPAYPGDDEMYDESFTTLELGGQLFTGDLFTVKEYNELVAAGAITDEDGFGDAVSISPDGRAVPLGWIRPSLAVPAGATHVLWYNK